MKVENNLDTDKVRGLVWRLAFPSMLAQFVNVMYSIVDRMYIGNIEGIGAVALAGVGGNMRSRGHPYIIVCQLDWSGRGASYEYPSGTEK